MSRFTVWIVSPQGYPHSRCFEEVALALACGLEEIGHETTITTHPNQLRGRVLVLGANLLLEGEPLSLPAGSILFNLEQIEEGSPWLHPRYLELLRRHTVLDYSRANVLALARLGIRARLCPIGYAPELTRITPTEESVDVLFYGSINDRRRLVLDQMRERGLRVEVAFGCYGQERDALIARSKVVLNLHAYDAKVFEIVRVSYLLANNRCVLSETGSDAELERPFAAGVAFASYDRLAETAVELVPDAQRRRQIAQAGFALFCAMRQADFLRQVEGGLFLAGDEADRQEHSHPLAELAPRPTSQGRLRYLVGPLRQGRAATFETPRKEGRCLTFGYSDECDVRLSPTSTWDELLARLPSGWLPDFVALEMGYATVPVCLWNAPVPLVAVAPDWQLQWHCLRLALPLCSLILTDQMGVLVMAKQGMNHARRANLFGLHGIFCEPAPEAGVRDVDVLFVGNLQPAVQGERLPWLGRIAQLCPRRRVMIAQGIRGEAYRDLLRRSKIVFNRSARGEVNLRVGEACSQGALLFQEGGNPEMQTDRAVTSKGLEHHGAWTHGVDCVFYDEENLEALLEHYLTHEDQRKAIAAAGKKKALQETFATCWDGVERLIESEWEQIRERHQDRTKPDADSLWQLRAWQALSASDVGDPSLPADLAKGDATAWMRGARAAVSALSARDREGRWREEALLGVTEGFHAAAPTDASAALALSEALALLGQRELASRGASRLLEEIAAGAELSLDCPPFPPGFSFLSVQWEKAAWANAGKPSAERQEKLNLLRWRAHALLAALTGETLHYHEATLARPDLPVSRAELGCALARQGTFSEAVIHLRFASQADPFDLAAARALFQALTDARQPQAAGKVADSRWRLHLAAPLHVPREQWFLPPETPRQPAQPQAPQPLTVRWQGEDRQLQRQMVERLSVLGCRVLQRDEAGTAEVTVRQSRTPDFSPARGKLVLWQSWPHGAVPIDWVVSIKRCVAEVWVPCSSAREGFVQSGVPAEKVKVVPFGIDAERFRPAGAAYSVPTTKAFKFLCVGSAHDDGIDRLLYAYRDTFRRSDDVCLVIKEAPEGPHRETSEELIWGFRSRLDFPELVYLDRDLSDEEMAALYRSCDCLVAPYRATGFGHSIAEAMSCGLPVIVTNHGAALDLCDEENAYLIPAQVVPFHERRVWGMDTVELPHLAEVDGHELGLLMRRVTRERDEARRKAEAGRKHVLERLSWAESAQAALARLRALTGRQVQPDAPMVVRAAGKPKKSLCIIAKNEEHNIGDCLHSARDLFDDVVVTDTGSTDRTKEIARQHGARVFEFPWIDHFAAARNACLEHAVGEWIFWLDCDDRLDEVNREKLRAHLVSLPEANVAYSMKCRCLPAPGQDGDTIVDHVRLFRNDPRIRWKYRIHEQILGAVKASGGEVLFADVTITHTGYADPALRGRKLARDMRLLEMEYAEQPRDPFTLFNLGMTCLELRQPERAFCLLEESLNRSHPNDSIVRKLFVLLSNCKTLQNRPDEALTICLKGQSVCPDDAELLYLEGVLRTESGDLHGAHAALVRLLGTQSGQHFASVVGGLRGHKGMHQLAIVCARMGQPHEAERLWRTALQEAPRFVPGLAELANLLLNLGRRREAEELLTRLEALPPQGPQLAAKLRGRTL